MNLYESESCCAVIQIASLGSEKDATTAFQNFYKSAKNNFENEFRFVLFSQSNDKKEKYGENFAAFIEKNKLGTITATPTKGNPAYDNESMVKVFIWTVDWNAVNTFRENDPTLKKLDAKRKAFVDKKMATLKKDKAAYVKHWGYTPYYMNTEAVYRTYLEGEFDRDNSTVEDW